MIKHKKVTYRDLEKKLDRIFSEYIRLKNADNNGYCQCITCGKIYHWKTLHCGHFISRSVKATRFSEINCNPQCVSCNSFKQGQHHIYRERLLEMYGKEGVERLESKANIGGSESSESLQMLINIYKEKVRLFKKEKVCN